MQGLTLPLMAVLLSASAWAVREDLLSHRIPNRLTGALLCAALALQFGFGGWSGLGQAALGALVGLAMLLPLYLLRATGAGDVKLLAAFGALLDPRWALIAGVYTLISGAVLALGYLMLGALRAAVVPAGASWVLRIYSARERALELRRERFPYAIAIVAGVLAAVAQRGDLQALFGYLPGRLR
ncbi:MAG: prepilin peptidase [Steroidobacterales bacterium]